MTSSSPIIVAAYEGYSQSVLIILVSSPFRASLTLVKVVDDFLPSLELHATWPSKEHAKLGNMVDPGKLRDEPSIELHDMRTVTAVDDTVDEGEGTGQRKKTTYVIVMTDPDAPSRKRPEWSEFCHWVASGTTLEDPDELVAYRPPAPPRDTGPHRYVLLALVPANGTTDRLRLSMPGARKRWGYDDDEDPNVRAAGGRPTKGVREWAAENGLRPVGEFLPLSAYFLPLPLLLFI